MKSFPRHAVAAVLFSALLYRPGCGAAQTILVPKGAKIDAALTSTLSSKTSHDGDTFTLQAKDSFFRHNPVPSGTLVDGHLENVTPAGPSHKATMVVVLDDIALPSEGKVPLHAELLTLKTFEPKTHHMRDVAVIVGSSVVGHIVSKRSGHGGGTLAGAAAGFALVSTMKSDIKVKAGTVVRFRVLDDVVATAGQ